MMEREERLGSTRMTVIAAGLGLEMVVVLVEQAVAGWEAVRVRHLAQASMTAVMMTREYLRRL